MKSSINENIQTASAAPRLVVYTNQSETHPTDQWKSITRPCFSCVESQVSCKSVAVCVLASDCLEKQKKILRQLEEKRTSSETEDAKLVDKNTGEILTISSPDDPHIDKNIVAEHDN